MNELLEGEARRAALAPLIEAGWVETPDGTAIVRTYTFTDFSEAFGWMTRAALAAEKAGHHPDWRNVWATVEVTLSTHSAGGLTALDVALAARMDALAAG